MTFTAAERIDRAIERQITETDLIQEVETVFNSPTQRLCGGQLHLGQRKIVDTLARILDLKPMPLVAGQAAKQKRIGI